MGEDVKMGVGSDDRPAVTLVTFLPRGDNGAKKGTS